MTESKSHGCRRAAASGCAAIAVLFVLAAVLAGLNFDRIQRSELGQKVARLWREGRASFGDMMALRSEILSSFPMENCEVGLHSVYGHPEKTLRISLINPNLPGEGDSEAWARKVAVFAVERYESVDSIHTVRIEIKREVRVGLRFSGSTSYSFQVAELQGSLPREAPEAGR